MTAPASPTAVREHPILFSGAMVRAILDGRKTQTRRVAKIPQWILDDALAAPRSLTSARMMTQCRYSEGDRLWVRESFQHFFKGEEPAACLYLADAGTHRWRQAASVEDAKASWPGWKPSIHMPRWASRLTLDIIGVRVERIQQITTADAWAEGIRPESVAEHAGDGTADLCDPETAVLDDFRMLWDSLNASRGYSWIENPWVWVLEFRRLELEQ